MIYLATKTIAAINEALQKDQGARYRQALQKVLPHMGDAYRGFDSPYRSHMGASLIGGECDRAIWYGFRWASKPSFDGRILRLFNRGHLEEGRFIALLLAAGVTYYQQDSNGKQFRIADAGGHFGGSCDGVSVGIPDLPAGVAALTEFKTHNDKSFQSLKKNGVKEAKFEHYVQMQIYMEKMGLTVGLYLAVNKNDDDLYGELVYLDKIIAHKFLQRGRDLVFARSAPKKLNESPGWFQCKFCSHRNVCHLKAEPEKNCRTCRYSVAREDGNWECRMLDIKLDSETQLKDCSWWEKEPTI